MRMVSGVRNLADNIWQMLQKLSVLQIGNISLHYSFNSNLNALFFPLLLTFTKKSSCLFGTNKLLALLSIHQPQKYPFDHLHQR